MTGPFIGLLGAARGVTAETRNATRIAREAEAREPTAVRGPHRSPFYDKYLDQQGHNILVETGDENAVREFFNLEKSTPLTRLPKRTNRGPVEEPDYSTGVMMNVIQGATFGFGDEAVAGLLAATTGLTYDETISEYRAELEQFRSTHKKTAIVAEIAGGILTGGLAARGFSAATRGAVSLDIGGATTGQRIGAAVTQGAAAGAVSGAGNTEGKIGVRMAGAILGAGLGAATGGVVSGLGIGIVTVGKAIIRAGARGFPRLLERVGISPDRTGREELYRAARNDGLIDDAGNLNYNEIASRARELEAQGITPTWLEIGGEATLDLANQAFKDLSPKTQKILEQIQQRQLGQDDALLGQLWGALSQNTKLGIDNAFDAIKHFNMLGKRLSAPWYEKAHAQTMPFTARIKELFDEHPVLRDAWNIGAAVTKGEDVQGLSKGLAVAVLSSGDDISVDAIMAANRGPNALSRAEATALAKAAGLASSPETLPIRGVDYMVRNLRAVYEKLDKSGKGLSVSQKRVVQSAIDELLEAADKASPAFANARGLYSTHKSFEKAIELGMGALNKPASVIRNELLELKPRDRDAYRLGFVEMLRETRTSNPDAAAELFGVKLFGGGGSVRSKRAQQMRAIFADAPDAADDFMGRVAAQARVSYTTPRISGGSFPGSQQAEEAVEGSIPTVRSTLVVAGIAAAQKGAVGAKRNFQQLVNHELVRLMSTGLRGGADEIVGFASALRDTERALMKRAQLGSRKAVGAGQVAGRVVGEFLTP